MHSLEETIQAAEGRMVPVAQDVADSPPVVTPVAEQVLKWLSGVRT